MCRCVLFPLSQVLKLIFCVAVPVDGLQLNWKIKITLRSFFSGDASYCSGTLSNVCKSLLLLQAHLGITQNHPFFWVMDQTAQSPDLVKMGRICSRGHGLLNLAEWVKTVLEDWRNSYLQNRKMLLPNRQVVKGAVFTEDILFIYMNKS